MAMNTDDSDLGTIDADVVTDPAGYDTFVAVFARTYSHSEDPAAVVDLYDDYQQLRAKYPDAGSSKLSTKLGVPRSTIRKWVDDGATPYVVQGLQTAETRGWIPMEFDSETFHAINKVVAWVMSSGTINADRWGVQFVVDGDDDRSRLEATLSTLGLETVEPEKPGTDLRGTVLSPTPDGSVLGRVLYSLGAPTGADKRNRDVVLPPYLDRVPARIRREWLVEYLRNRERTRDTGEEWISFGEKRSESYKRGFVQLVEDVTGAGGSTSGTEVYISANAVTALELSAERYAQLQSNTDPLPLTTRDSLAGTYTNQENPLKRLEQYRRFQAADGYWTNIAREHDISMSRAERWHNGSKPAVAAAVGVAEENGWFADKWTDTVEALATLVVGIHAGGSIGATYGPQWQGTSAFADRIREALETVGTGARIRQGSIVPARHGSALGRLLVTAGAPRAGQEIRGRLPDWLFLVSPERREDWLRMFVSGRGSQFKERSPSRHIRIDRPQSYFTDISVLIETVTGIDAPVHNERVSVPADVIRELGLA